MVCNMTTLYSLSVLDKLSFEQAVEVRLEPAQSGGEGKLNLEALQQAENEGSHSLPIVRTSVLAVSPHQPPAPGSPSTSEIQPDLSAQHQASLV